MTHIRPTPRVHYGSTGTVNYSGVLEQFGYNVPSVYWPKNDKSMTGDQMTAFFNKQSHSVKSYPRKFVPIADIDGYINALRVEGKTSESDLKAIREKHIKHMPVVEEPPKPTWTPKVTDVRRVYTKLVVGKTKVKVVAYAPFDPLIKWWDRYPGRVPPIDVLAECRLLNGMPVDEVEKMIKRHEKLWKKIERLWDESQS